MPPQPEEIRRIGLAVELASGEKVFLFSDQLEAGTVTIERKIEEQEIWPGYPQKMSRPQTTATVTIEGLRGYQLIYNEQAQAALEASIRSVTE